MMALTKQRGITIILLIMCIFVVYQLAIHSEHFRRKMSTVSQMIPSIARKQVQEFVKKQIKHEAGTSTEEASDNKHSRKPQHLLLRKPDVNRLLKLTRKEKEIERVTEPLPPSPTCTEAVYLAIIVVSAPGNFEQRNAIRGSWASAYHRQKHTMPKTVPFPRRKFEDNNVVKTVFVIGRDSKKETQNLVEAEARTFGDIVLGEFYESYRNLTMKTRLGLKWAYYHCRVDFLLKTDDDVFVNPVPLVEWLKQVQQTQLYTGWCNFGSPVVRDKRNKWYVSEKDFSGDHYPGYCLGGGYLMSEDVLERVMRKSYGRKLFPMEDLYVGIMISEFKDIAPRDEKGHFDLVFSGRKACETRSLFLAHQVAARDQLLWLNRYEYEERTCK